MFTDSRGGTPRARAPRKLADRAFGGFLWQTGGAGLKGVFQIGFLAILARYVTPDEFGLVGAALIVVGLSSLFSQMGIGPAIVHERDLTDEHLRLGFWISVLLSAFAALLVWLSAPAIAAFFSMPDLEPVLAVLSLVFVLRGISVVSESLLQRELAFASLSAIEVGSYLFGYGAAGVVLALLGYGYWSLVGAHVAQSAVQTILLLRVRPHPMRPIVRTAAGRSLLSYGFGHTLARLANHAALQGDNLVVGRMLGASALGIYGRAYQLLVTPAILLGTALDRVLFPAMAIIQNDRSHLAEVYRKGIGVTALVALPLTVILLAVAPEIVGTLLGPQWTGAVAPFQVLAVGLLFRTSYKISDSLVRATGRVYGRAWRQGVYAALVIGGSIIGARWGVVGVAAGTLFAIAANFAIMAQMSLRETGLSFRRFLGAHASGARLAAVVGAVAYAAAYGSRRAGLPDPIVLVIVAVTVVLTSRALLLRLWPRTFLGGEGLWMLATAGRNMPRRLLRWLVPARALEVAFATAPAASGAAMAPAVGAKAP